MNKDAKRSLTGLSNPSEAFEKKQQKAFVSSTDKELIFMENTPEKSQGVLGRMKRVTLNSMAERTEENRNHAHLSPKPKLFAPGSVRYNDITLFLRQLIMLLESGVSILRALKSLAMRSERAATKNLFQDIAQCVEGGNALWQAFDRHPYYFDSVFVNLIRSSEASGTLAIVLKRITEYRATRETLRKRVRGAMIYPVLLIVATIVALFVITSFVVPVFAEFFMRSNMDIPRNTRLLIEVSAAIRSWWWTPLALLALLAALYQFWFVRDIKRRLAIDYLKLKLPIIGTIIHKNAITEMCRTMGLLLRSGLSLLSTLDLTKDAIHNRAVAESLSAMRSNVEKGGGLEEPMRASGVLPPVIVDMFVTGEESGRVDQVAEQIADVYEEEVRLAIGGLAEALQPVFTLIIGTVVLILFVSLFLPMISMIDQLGAASGL